MSSVAPFLPPDSFFYERAQELLRKANITTIDLDNVGLITFNAMITTAYIVHNVENSDTIENQYYWEQRAIGGINMACALGAFTPQQGNSLILYLTDFLLRNNTLIDDLI